MHKRFLDLNEQGREIFMITHETEMAGEAKTVYEIMDGVIAGRLK